MKNIVRRVFWALMRLMPESVVRSFRRRHYLSALRQATGAVEPEMVVIESLVKPGDRCLDIGANFGLYSQELSRLVGSTGRVFSFEPVPSTYELLVENLRQLKLSNVTALQYAIGDTDGQVTMRIPNWDYGAPNYYVAHVATAGDEEGEAVSVPARRIDGVSELGKDRIAFVKCDVEGHELAAVKGAMVMARRDLPAWFIEISGDPDLPGSNAEGVVSLLAQAGYGVYRYDGKKVVPRVRGDQSINYFFLQPAHTQQLKHAGLA